MDLSVVIPAFNESSLVERVARAALKDLAGCGAASYELVLVDDGSTDDTKQFMAAVASSDPHVRVVGHETNRGLGAALRTGFQNSQGEYVTWIAGDGQVDLRDVLAELPLMEQCDVVVFIREGRKGQGRALISLGFHLLIRTLFQFDATDMCGIYIIRRGLLEEIAPKSENIFLNLEIPILCVRKGKRIREATLQIKPRLAGVSKVSDVRTMVKNLIEMLKFRFG